MERRKSFVRRIGEQDAFRCTMLMLTKPEGITVALLRSSPLAMDKQNVIEQWQCRILHCASNPIITVLERIYKAKITNQFNYLSIAIFINVIQNKYFYKYSKVLVNRERKLIK